MARAAKRGAPLPHARYGVDLSKVPDTYIEPFVAYRAWNWLADGTLTSLNQAVWTPRQPFEATCAHAERNQGMLAACSSPAAKEFWEQQAHRVPDPDCTCGMYAGINMQHLLDINYIQRGIHGEVHLWGRLMRHTLGWRAQFAYPKNFVVPADMLPYRLDDAQKRLASLVEFGVDISLQPLETAKVGQQTVPLWVPDYGYSAQGVEFLVERARKQNAFKLEAKKLKPGDRLAVFTALGSGGGIGVVKGIDGGEVSFTLFSPGMVYHKKLKDVVWNERNWRWETTGTGFGRRVS